MNLKVLEELALTKVEAKIFSELILSGDMPIGSIITKTGLHRGTVYNSLKRLINKGYVCFIEKEGKRFYSTSDIKLLEKELNEKKEEISKGIDLIKNIIKSEKSTKQNITQYAKIDLGHIAFKKFFKDMYETSKKLNKEYLSIGHGGEIQKEFGEKYYLMIKRLRKRMGVKSRLILNEKARLLPYFKNSHDNVRFLATRTNNPVTFWIYGNKVVIVLFGSKPLIMITVEDKNVADSFRDYFERLWALEEIIFVYGRKAYTASIIRNLEESKEFKEISKYPPFLFYPQNKKDFFRLRKIIKSERETLCDSKSLNLSYEINNAYKKACKSGNKLMFIQGEEEIIKFFKSYEDVFGKEETKKKIKEIFNELKKYKIIIKTVKNIEPYINIHITPNELVLGSIHNEEVIGFSTSGNKIIKIYEKIFDNMYKNSKDLKTCLNKLLKKPK